MKTNVQTLNQSASHRLSQVINQWLNTSSSFFSEINGNDVTYRSIISILVLSLSIAGAIVCITDQIAEYGWAAFFAMLSLHLIVNKLRGGNHGK